MYIIKFSRESYSFIVDSKVWSKEWSEDLNSHIITLIAQKRTVSFWAAKRWADSIVTNDLFLREKLVILHGQC
jgi:hypothetical protein